MGLPLYSAGFATGPKARPLARGPKAPVAELVDALDSKSSSARSAGSIPAGGTTALLRRADDRRVAPISSPPRPSRQRAQAFSRTPMIRRGEPDNGFHSCHA